MSNEQSNYYIEAVTQYEAVHREALAAAKDLGLTAIEQGHMTRVEVAAILDVHPNTISRWLTAHEVEHER